MPRYYFDLHDGHGVAEDEEGMELSSMRQVQEEAARSLADMIREASSDTLDSKSRRWAVEVRDENGSVFELKFTFDEGTTRH
ncbi:DUF6894 family protein [Bradyrhizobium liaoningense]|uniref:DUF6894 family protein n=1 Tax=Bradyrhizobium liaoningense TaxID=43992 RepID=UPI001BAB4539|nr:hypothetical protein [Bradyrhizobium liaoningense]MBR0707976.1 hypothetical protein [Bradyrhizobium liaoningense]